MQVKIGSFWVEGFRSIKRVRLTNLGPFNIFYGPNGSGKSNVLAAMGLFCRLLRSHGTTISGDIPLAVPSAQLGLKTTDFRVQSPQHHIVVGAEILAPLDSPLLQLEFPGATVQLHRLWVEFRLTWFASEGGRLSVRLNGGRRGEAEATMDLRTLMGAKGAEALAALLGDAVPEFSASEWDQTNVERWRILDVSVRQTLPDNLFRVVDATRVLKTEALDEAAEWSKDAGNSAEALLAQGRLKTACYLMHTSKDRRARRAFEDFRTLLQGSPLFRPPVDPVRDLDAKIYDLQERVTGSEDDAALPLDQSGLGVQQIYFVLAEILFGGASAVAVEEPEAHLHAPTTGRHLRVLLKRLVEEGHVQQLFIATHSNLFDLDEKGYFDVRLDEHEGTVIQYETDLTRIDRDHLYEPGPAKRALLKMLSYVDPGVVVFKNADGEPISASDMVRKLQADDDDAVAFLADLHGAMARVVRLKHQPPKDAA